MGESPYRIMNDPAASSGVSSSLLGLHSVLDTESSRAFWIPAFAGMTNSRQAAGNAPQGIQKVIFERAEPVQNSTTNWRESSFTQSGWGKVSNLQLD
jgi:hypothetical protein